MATGEEVRRNQAGDALKLKESLAKKDPCPRVCQLPSSEFFLLL